MLLYYQKRNISSINPNLYPDGKVALLQPQDMSLFIAVQGSSWLF